LIRIERHEVDRDGTAALAGRLREMTPEVGAVGGDVAAIVAEVRERGDEALRAIGERLGEPASRLRVDRDAVDAALDGIDGAVADALAIAARNIEAGARRELEAVASSTPIELPEGQSVEVVRAPVAAAGVYAPGGRGAYPSSVLMCAIPARVAGVERVAVATPPGEEGEPAPAVLAACAVAGVGEVYSVGGAQAIAALAFGTATIAPVDVIAGPGGRYVTEAKRQVAGRVGLDGIAGPSELVVVADGSASAKLIALDLCAQAEHGDDSPLVVASPERGVLEAIAGEVAEIAGRRTTVAAAPLALVATPDVATALELADAFAPEHLELAFEGGDEDSARSRIAGCVFVGAGGATAFGDYAAGSNHVLPTGGAARFAGPLGPGAFLRRTSVVSIPAIAADALQGPVEALAQAEGFPVHGESARARAEEGNR